MAGDYQQFYQFPMRSKKFTLMVNNNNNLTNIITLFTKLSSPNHPHSCSPPSLLVRMTRRHLSLPFAPRQIKFLKKKQITKIPLNQHENWDDVSTNPRSSGSDSPPWPHLGQQQRKFWMSS